MQETAIQFDLDTIEREQQTDLKHNDFKFENGYLVMKVITTAECECNTDLVLFRDADSDGTVEKGLNSIVQSQQRSL